MNITVYLGANAGNDPTLRKAVQELGAWIGTSGNALIYGGSKTGLMGEIAKSVLEAGGNVTGVEPQFFMDEGFQYDGLTELIVTKDRLSIQVLKRLPSKTPKTIIKLIDQGNTPISFCKKVSPFPIYSINNARFNQKAIIVNRNCLSVNIY